MLHKPYSLYRTHTRGEIVKSLSLAAFGIGCLIKPTKQISSRLISRANLFIKGLVLRAAQAFSAIRCQIDFSIKIIHSLTILPNRSPSSAQYRALIPHLPLKEIEDIPNDNQIANQAARFILSTK